MRSKSRSDICSGRPRRRIATRISRRRSAGLTAELLALRLRELDSGRRCRTVQCGARPCDADRPWLISAPPKRRSRSSGTFHTELSDAVSRVRAVTTRSVPRSPGPRKAFVSAARLRDRARADLATSAPTLPPTSASRSCGTRSSSPPPRPSCCEARTAGRGCARGSGEALASAALAAAEQQLAAWQQRWEGIQSRSRCRRPERRGRGGRASSSWKIRACACARRSIGSALEHDCASARHRRDAPLEELQRAGRRRRARVADAGSMANSSRGAGPSMHDAAEPPDGSADGRLERQRARPRPEPRRAHVARSAAESRAGQEGSEGGTLVVEKGAGRGRGAATGAECSKWAPAGSAPSRPVSGEIISKRCASIRSNLARGLACERSPAAASGFFEGAGAAAPHAPPHDSATGGPRARPGHGAGRLLGRRAHQRQPGRQRCGGAPYARRRVNR